MAIKFLRDHHVDGPPKEAFVGGEIVKDRNEASEMHFVRRGHAAYLDETSGALTDHDGNPVEDPFPKGKDDNSAGAIDDLAGIKTAKLKGIAKKEGVTVADDADDAALRTAIQAHRAAQQPAADGLDSLTDEDITEKVTLTGIAVEPGADRAAKLAALREHARLAANGQ